MSLIQPNGTVRVLRDTGLNNTYQHTRYFASRSAQTSYFEGKTHITLTDQSYSRPSRGFIRIERKATDLYNCDYLMFRNAEYGDKWFYAFITSIDYISNNTSQINFELDVIQTWFFEYDLGECFVKRCHTSTDSIGEHLEPEPVSFSDYKYDELSSLILAPSLIYLTFAPFKLPYSGSQTDVPAGGHLCGMYQGLAVQAWTETELSNNLLGLREEVASSIISIVGVPTGFISYQADHSVLNGSNYSQDVACMTYSRDFESYTPQNNKLFTYPYNALYVTSLSGQSQLLRWEYFENPSAVEFNLTLAVQPNPELVVAPLKYGGGLAGSSSSLIYPNYDYKITFSDFPKATWCGNYFASWFANQGIKEVLGAVTGVIGSMGMTGSQGVSGAGVSSKSSGSVGAGVAGAVTTGMSVGVDFANASYHPDIPHGNGGGGNGIIAKQGVDIKCYRKFINRNDAQRIDKFFTVFGYAVNTYMQVPRKNRPHWTFVQTVNCTVRGDMPAGVAGQIAEIHNHGITYWNGGTIGDYNRDNRPS